MTSTASPVGTLVKSEDTSKLTNDSSGLIVMSLIVSAKCLEFRTCELVLPAKGEIICGGYVLGKLVGGGPIA